MPRHEPEVEAAIAKDLLRSIELGDKLWNGGYPVRCERAMRMCSKPEYDSGRCDCARWDAAEKKL